MPLSNTGKVTYYAIRIEFQERGSPHVHSFIWILNPPKLSEVCYRQKHVLEKLTLF